MKSPPSIFLLGPPGAGKTTLGSWACKELDFEFLDLAEVDLERLSRVVGDTAADVVELPWELHAIVDPASGETTALPEFPDAIDPALVDWLGSEMDGELLEVLHRYRARAKGHAPEQPRTDIDVVGLL